MVVALHGHDYGKDGVLGDGVNVPHCDAHERVEMHLCFGILLG